MSDFKIVTLVTVSDGYTTETQYKVYDVLYHNSTYKSVCGNICQVDKLINISPKSINDTITLYRYLGSMISCENYQNTDTSERVTLYTLECYFDNFLYKGRGLNLQQCIEHCFINSTYRYHYKIIEIDHYIYDKLHNSLLVYAKVKHQDTVKTVPIQLENVTYTIF